MFNLLKMIFLRWPKKTFIVACLTLILFLIIKLLQSKSLNTVLYFHDSSNLLKFTLVTDSNDDSYPGRTLVPWIPKFSHLYSCPACFGYQMCNDINKGSILFHGEMSVSHNTRITWKKGVLHAERVLISSLSIDEWNKYDDFLCRNASQASPCNLSAAIQKNILTTGNLLSFEKFHYLNILLDIPYTQLTLSACASNKLLIQICNSFDDDFDGILNDEEKILLITSLIMQPSYVILKLQTRTRMNMPIPNLLGACGRSVIIEGGLTSLKSYLTESFDTRAGLAIQVLQLVEDFEEEDPQWYFLYMGFSLDSIVVTKDGEVITIDLDDLVILDKSAFPAGVKEKSLIEELCNEVCFQMVTQAMFYTVGNASVCSYIPQYGQLMYAIVCKQVLSNLGEHKAEGFFNFDGHRVHKKLEHPGLLHSIPDNTKEKLEDMLRECVQETKPNGRRNAVIHIRKILENYASDESEGHFHKDGSKRKIKKTLKGR